MQNNWTLKTCQGTSLVVQWLRCWASSAWGLRWIPGWRIKILCVPLWGKKKSLNLWMNNLYGQLQGLFPKVTQLVMVRAWFEPWNL